MSIETLLQNLIEAVNRNTEALNKPFVEPLQTQTSVPVQPVLAATPVQPIPTEPVMPAAPVFTMPSIPVPPPVAEPAPFNSIAELVKYATDKYYALGANAAKISDVIQALGYQNINDIRPEHFKPFFDQVELIQKG